MKHNLANYVILPDPEAISRAAAERFVTLAQEHDPFAVALSGGSTPRRLYEILAGPPFRDQIPWLRTLQESHPSQDNHQEKPTCPFQAHELSES